MPETAYSRGILDAPDFLLRLVRLESKDCYQTLRQWRPAADAGDAPAAYQVGKAFLASRMPRRAVPYLRQAADGGILAAAEDLARLLDRRKRYDEAREWYRRAGDLARDQQLPAVQIADYYRSAGQFDEAEQVLRPAAEQGDARAAASLGMILEFPGNRARRLDEAEHWYRIASNLGDQSVRPSLNRLRGYARQLAEAEEQYRHAAEQGDYDAARSLASALRLAGRTAEADEWDQRASRLWMDHYHNGA